MTTENPNLSARDCAKALANPKLSAKARAAVEARVRAMAASSARAKWVHLAAALDAGDTARIEARATGDWSAVQAERAAAKKPAPKAKRPSRKARKAPAAKAQRDAADALKGDIDKDALAAFTALPVAARNALAKLLSAKK